MRAAGPAAGALVVDGADGRVLYSLRPDSPRVPASNEKLLVTAAALLRYGSEGTLTTRVLGTGSVDATGTYRGNLYLRGGGDPTFGSLSFTRRAYGGGATTYELARLLAQSGVRRVQGLVMGDESVFDRRRGSYGFGISRDIGGPISGLAYDRGLSSQSGTGFQLRPATFAASQLIVALRARGVSVIGRPGETHDARRRSRAGTGAIAAHGHDRPAHQRPVRQLPGRGAAQGDGGVVRAQRHQRRRRRRGAQPPGRAGRQRPRGRRVRAVAAATSPAPRQLVRLITAMDRSSVGEAFRASLAVAGRSGTLAHRMGGTAAAGRCHGKTGTLRGVSALSGYCDTVGGRRLVFSILMNGVNVYGARSLQNAMTVAIARYPVSAGAARAPAPAVPARR